MLSESMVIEHVTRKFRVLSALRKMRSHLHRALIGHQILRILEETVVCNTA